MALIASLGPSGLDMYETYLGSGHLPVPAMQEESGFQLTYPDGVVVHLRGSGFTYDDEGVVVAGLVAGLSEMRQGQTAFSVTSLSLPAARVREWIEEGGIYDAWSHILSGDDRIDGSAHDDLLIGGDGADELVGGDGDDGLDGGAGDDVLIGGAGADYMSGGAGNDVFRGYHADFAGDLIDDFGSGDRIVIDDATIDGFSFSLTGGKLTLGTGEVLLLEGFDGNLRASAAIGGGVALSVSTGVRLGNDFNGDGRSDVLWREAGGSLTNWLGKADGGLVNNDGAAYVGAPGDWQIVGTGDFNGDGRSDVLWRNANGLITNWIAKGDGGFSNNDNAALSASGPAWQVAAVEDFNGDGRADVLIRNDHGTIAIWQGRSDGGFAKDGAPSLGVSSDWTIVGAGDFDGDGRADILWRHDSGLLTNWLGKADGGFENNDLAAMTLVATQWEVVGTGDFNGDGRSDILWRSDQGDFSNWLGREDGGFSNNDAVAYTKVDASWQVVDTGDYNGDGRFDLLWRHANGSLTTWLGRPDGGFANNDIYAFVATPTNWHVQGADFFL